LRIILFQSLVQGLCVAAEKREKESTKEKKLREVLTVLKKFICSNKRKNKRQKKERRKK
jgi:hypothetical protein